MTAQRTLSTTSSPATSQVVDHIRDRAETMPGVVAVRFGGDAVTYGELTDRIDSCTEVMARQGMSQLSAFHAALLTTLPALSALPADRLADSIEDILMWLARGMAEDSRGLRAIG